MYLKTLLILLAIGLTLSFEPGHAKESYIFKKFQEFIETHNKKYTTIEEYIERFRVFESNYKKMESMQITGEDEPSFTLGITKFSDLTPQEFRNTYLNLKISLNDVIKNRAHLSFLEQTDAPDSHDLRAQFPHFPLDT